MNFLHSEVDEGSREIVRVTLEQRANVKVMDVNNFGRYRNGQRHDYYGGLAEASPLDLRSPHQGRWNVVVDLGGYGGTLGVSVAVVQ